MSTDTVPPPVEAPPETESAPPPPRRSWRIRRFGAKFLVFSVLSHVLFLAVAAYLIVQKYQTKPKLTFRSGPKGSTASTRTLEHKVQMKKQNTLSAPPQAKRVTTSGLSKISLPDMPAMPSMSTALSPGAVSGMGAAGLAPGGFGGGTGGMGGNGGAAINFFGLRAKSAKRIAFLLDYSGSMSGAFRERMQQEMDRSLKALPAGTQILVIPWAGPAWLYNERAPQIAGKWKKIDGYDNFATLPNVTLPNPTWVTTSSESIGNLIKNIAEQTNLPGGTDWRSPFRYAMQASPPPDTFFFLTDGQIPAENVQRALNDINTALSKEARPPQVNCLWITNKKNAAGAEPLRTLAKKYNGSFVEVGEK